MPHRHTISSHECRVGLLRAACHNLNRRALAHVTSRRVFMILAAAADELRSTSSPPEISCRSRPAATTSALPRTPTAAPLAAKRAQPCARWRLCAATPAGIVWPRTCSQQTRERRDSTSRRFQSVELRNTCSTVKLAPTSPPRPIGGAGTFPRSSGPHGQSGPSTCSSSGPLAHALLLCRPSSCASICGDWSTCRSPSIRPQPFSGCIALRRTIPLRPPPARLRSSGRIERPTATRAAQRGGEVRALEAEPARVHSKPQPQPRRRQQAIARASGCCCGRHRTDGGAPIRGVRCRSHTRTIRTPTHPPRRGAFRLSECHWQCALHPRCQSARLTISGAARFGAAGARLSRCCTEQPCALTG